MEDLKLAIDFWAKNYYSDDVDSFHPSSESDALAKFLPLLDKYYLLKWIVFDFFLLLQSEEQRSFARSVRIKNFLSLQDELFQLSDGGKFQLFIGSNDTGKSNIIRIVAFAAAFDTSGKPPSFKNESEAELILKLNPKHRRLIAASLLLSQANRKSYRLTMAQLLSKSLIMSQAQHSSINQRGEEKIVRICGQVIKFFPSPTSEDSEKKSEEWKEELIFSDKKGKYSWEILGETISDFFSKNETSDVVFSPNIQFKSLLTATFVRVMQETIEIQASDIRLTDQLSTSRFSQLKNHALTCIEIFLEFSNPLFLNLGSPQWKEVQFVLKKAMGVDLMFNGTNDFPVSGYIAHNLSFVPTHARYPLNCLKPLSVDAIDEIIELKDLVIQSSSSTDPVSLAFCSSGIIDFLTVICVSELSNAGTVFFDEPGTYLHISKRKYLRQFLTSGFKNQNVVVVSHMSELLGEDSLPFTWYFFKEDNRLIRTHLKDVLFKNIDKKASTCLDPRLTGIFFSDFILFAEGASERRVWEAFIYLIEQDEEVKSFLETDICEMMTRYTLFEMSGCAESEKLAEIVRDLGIVSRCKFLMDIDACVQSTQTNNANSNTTQENKVQTDNDTPTKKSKGQKKKEQKTLPNDHGVQAEMRPIANSIVTNDVRILLKQSDWIPSSLDHLRRTALQNGIFCWNHDLEEIFAKSDQILSWFHNSVEGMALDDKVESYHLDSMKIRHKRSLKWKENWKSFPFSVVVLAVKHLIFHSPEFQDLIDFLIGPGHPQSFFFRRVNDRLLKIMTQIQQLEQKGFLKLIVPFLHNYGLIKIHKNYLFSSFSGGLTIVLLLFLISQ